MYLVTQSKGRINQLGFTPKTQTYTYLHKGVVIWEEKGNSDLFDYFNQQREKGEFVDYAKTQSFAIFRKYSQSCQEIEQKEIKNLYNLPKLKEINK